MYCNEDCKKKAHDEAHRYECEFINKLHSMPNIVNLTIKTFFKALSMFDGSVDELEKHIAGHLYGNKKSTIFDFDFTNMSEKEADKAKLLVLCSGLQQDQHKDLLIMMMMLFKEHSMWEKMTEFQQLFVRTLLVTLFKILYVNVYFVKHSDANTENVDRYIDVGTSYSTFFSLINNSCISNIVIISTGEYQVLVATEQIKKGEQLTFEYA